MSILELREYQKQYVDELQNSFKKGNKKIVLCAPTGSGKTVMFSYMCKNAFTKIKNTYSNRQEGIVFSVG